MNVIWLSGSCTSRKPENHTTLFNCLTYFIHWSCFETLWGLFSLSTATDYLCVEMESDLFWKSFCEVHHISVEEKVKKSSGHFTTFWKIQANIIETVVSKHIFTSILSLQALWCFCDDMVTNESDTFTSPSSENWHSHVFW